MKRVRAWADRQVAQMLSDYFPTRLSVLDRDLTLGIVQATLDYGRRFGLSRVEADRMLVLDDAGAVTIRAEAPWLTWRSLGRLPCGIGGVVAGLRYRPIRWVTGELARLLQRVEDVRAVPVRDRSTYELIEIIRQGRDIRLRMFTSRSAHFLPSFSLKIALVGLGRLTPRPLRTVGIPGDHPTARFRADLRQLARAWAAVQAGQRDALELVPLFNDFLKRHGGRGNTFVPLVSDRVWDTHPDDLIAMLPALSRAAEPDLASEGPSRGIRGRLGEIALERDWLAHGYEAATRIIRDAVHELGTRLASIGRLESAGDIIHLTFTELETLVDAGIGPPWDRLATRRAAFRRAGLPSAPQPRQATTEPTTHASISGLAAAPGQYRGTARVITAASDFGLLQPGDVLVCQMTSPAWMPLLMVAGAVVSDLGGLLSHAAIVAREFGIPAVTNTGDATAKMVSGGLYLVDGSRGVVKPAAPSAG